MQGSTRSDRSKASKASKSSKDARSRNGSRDRLPVAPTMTATTAPNGMRGSELRHFLNRRGAATQTYTEFQNDGGEQTCLRNAVAKVIVWETDQNARMDMGLGSATLQVVLDVINKLFLAVFTVELVMRIFAWRSRFFRGAHSNMNMFDFFVVVTDILSQLLAAQMPSTSALRVMRLAKLSRAMRTVKQIKELYVIISGLAAAIRAIFWGACVIFVLLIFWSVLSVEFLRPMVHELAQEGVFDDCGRCVNSFDTIFMSMLTLTQQIIAGDSWGSVSVPLIYFKPEAAFIMVTALVSVNCGVLNLLLSAIVDSANERREKDKMHKMEEKTVEYAQAKEELFKLCKELDVDDSGTITLQELQDGYLNNRDFFSLMHLLDMELEDLEVVFKSLDTDRSGSVTHDEFVDSMHKMKTQELQPLLVHIRCHLTEVEEKLSTQWEVLKEEMVLIRRLEHGLEGKLNEEIACVKAVEKTLTESQRDRGSPHRSFDNIVFKRGVSDASQSESPRKALAQALERTDLRLDALCVLLQAIAPEGVADALGGGTGSCPPVAGLPLPVQLPNGKAEPPAPLWHPGGWHVDTELDPCVPGSTPPGRKP